MVYKIECALSTVVYSYMNIRCYAKMLKTRHLKRLCGLVIHKLII